MKGKSAFLIILNIILAVVVVIGGYKFWLIYQGDLSTENKTETLQEDIAKDVQKKEERESLSKEIEPPELCAQVISYARNPQTGACQEFSTPCDIPQNWRECLSADKTDKINQPATESFTDKNSDEPAVKKESSQEQITAGETDKNILKKVYLYYFKGEQPQGDCTNTVKVARPLDPSYELEEVSALVTLLLPLPQELVEQGYYSEIPPFTRLRNLSISKEVATADFNEILSTGGGSCSMAARRAQIENTLLQFPDIKKVVITVDGQADTALQP